MGCGCDVDREGDHGWTPAITLALHTQAEVRRHSEHINHATTANNVTSDTYHFTVMSHKSPISALRWGQWVGRGLPGNFLMEFPVACDNDNYEAAILALIKIFP